MEQDTNMTKQQIAEAYEAETGHPYLPVRYMEETEPIPNWMLGLFGLMGLVAILFVMAAA